MVATYLLVGVAVPKMGPFSARGSIGGWLCSESLRDLESFLSMGMTVGVGGRSTSLP